MRERGSFARPVGTDSAERIVAGSVEAGLAAEAPNKAPWRREGGSNSVVESQPSKLLVAGSIPVSRSTDLSHEAQALCELRPGERWWRADGVSVPGGAGGTGGERSEYADVAQLAERVLGKDEVTSSILVIGSRGNRRRQLSH